MLAAPRACRRAYDRRICPKMGNAASSISDRAEAERCPDAAQKRADTCDWNAPDLDLDAAPCSRHAHQPGGRLPSGSAAISGS